MDDIQHQRKRILASGLFDPEYYRISDPTADAAENGLGHFLKTGASRGRDPHPLFDTSFYVERYPDAASSGLNPLYHYLTVGARADYQTHPLFDGAHYRRLYGGSIPAKTSPLEHYVRSKMPHALSTHLLFNLDYYGLDGPMRTNLSPLAHYVLHWRQQRRSPHPCFDLEYYLEHCTEARMGAYDPLSHYLLIGWREGYHPHPLFDSEFYLRKNPDVRTAGVNPLLHFISGGGLEGRDPHPWFDSSYYCELYPDVAAVKKNPLVHYLEAGEREGRSAHPLFNAQRWANMQEPPQSTEGSLVRYAKALESNAHPLVALRLHKRGQRPLGGLPGVNVIGYPRVEIGVSEHLREVARSLAAVSVNFAVKDLSTGGAVPGDDSVNHWIRPDCVYNTNLFSMNADNMTESCMLLGHEVVSDRFNIGCWYWELADFPDAWRSEMCVLDELWASTTFIQKSLSMKADIPVVFAPPPVTLPAAVSLGRAYFGIPEDRFAFLFQFDFSSFIERKNPYAAIAAFRQAFPSRSSPVALVIKTSQGSRYPEQLKKLLDAMGNDPNIILIQGTLRRERVISLMKSADAFLSLHRSEGFGRGLAESMLLGKPVIGTNYSGNTDFMTPENSCPVNYTLVPVLPGQYPFGEGQVWAEADIDHAAWYMRRLVQNREYRQALSQAAQKTILENYSSEATGKYYLRRLQVLGLVEKRAAMLA